MPGSNENLFDYSNFMRIYGDTRYETSIDIAKKLKKALGVSKFDTVIVSYGLNYADALSGSYLASLTNAPILIVNPKSEFSVNLVRNYINNNLSDDGKIYVLGGASVIPDSFLTDLENDGWGRTVTRLAGEDRYMTNYLVLQECLKYDPTPEIVLICDANSFADALSASAVGCPMVLTSKKKGRLYDYQKIYLDYLSDYDLSHAYVIGGTAAVPKTIMSDVSAYTYVDRIYGEDRYQTSVSIAYNFFSAPATAVVAFGKNYPDGLCAGPLANALGVPLLLTSSGSISTAISYIKDEDVYSTIYNLAIIGGESGITHTGELILKYNTDSSMLTEYETYELLGYLIKVLLNYHTDACDYCNKGRKNTDYYADALDELFAIYNALVDAYNLCQDYSRFYTIKNLIAGDIDNVVYPYLTDVENSGYYYFSELEDAIIDSCDYIIDIADEYYAIEY